MDTEVQFVEEPEVRFADRRRKVWLECDGELYDLRAAQVLGIHFLAHDLEVVRFGCPRCRKSHQSLLFR